MMIFHFLFLFSIGSLFGWCLEVLFRKRFSSTNPEHKWINPGFCTGSYLPLYGIGACVLYLLSSVRFALPTFWNNVLIVLLIAVCMTAIEYLVGCLCLKFYKVRLWNYSNMRGNIQGIVCPLFSFFWGLLGAVYFFLLHPFAVDFVAWFTNHAFLLFFLGLLYGIFLVDLGYSLRIIHRLKQLAVNSKFQILMQKYENLIQSKLTYTLCLTFPMMVAFLPENYI